MESSPYLIVNPDILTRLQEAQRSIEEIAVDLSNEVYRADVLYDENCHLRKEYEVKCDEKRACDEEILRLQEILTKNKIDFQEKGDD